MTRDPFATAVRAYVGEAAEADNSLNPSVLAAAFVAANEELVARKTDQLVLAAVRRVITALGRSPEDNGQLALLPGLPRYVCVASDDWRPLGKATFADLLAGRKEREAHIDAARMALAEYDAELDKLRPIMEPNPDMTVVDALIRLAGEPNAEQGGKDGV